MKTFADFEREDGQLDAPRVARYGEIGIDRARFASDESVWILLDRHGRVLSVSRDGARTREKAETYTREPLSDGRPDPDAPYTAEEWMVQR